MSEQSSSQQNIKVWIGNIDTKLTEYQLLKILEHFGQITSFDFLYHINDRGGRVPRGYAFATFLTGKGAADAIKNLHKKKVLNRELVVRYATAKSDPMQRIADKPIPAALRAGSKKELSDQEKEQKIKDLEAKLRLMEEETRVDTREVTKEVEDKLKNPPRFKPY